MKKDFVKRTLLILLSTFIITIETCIFACTWLISYSSAGSSKFVRGNLVVIGLYALILFFFNKIYGGFRIRQSKTLEMICSQIIAVFFTNIITYFQLALIGHWGFLTNLAPIINMTLIELAVIIIYAFFSRWIYVKFFPPREILVVCGDSNSSDIIRKFSARPDKYSIKEVISIEEDVEYIKQRIVNFDNILLADIPDELRNELLKYCFSKNIRCYVISKISDIIIRSAKEINLFDTSVLLAKNNGPSLEQLFFKRILDVICALLAIIVTSPLMICFAILIKLHDGGPVIFKQKRLTKDGQIFEIYKFRSMRAQTSEEHYLTRKDDDRITPVGKVLRKLHLDELPQLINILKGEMSFVGPRPECPEIAEQYKEIVSEFDFRLKVKAGLTGYAQVFGKYNTTPDDKLKLDLEYIENYSILLDIKLLMLTFKILFDKENTEGIENWQTTAATTESSRDSIKTEK